MNKLFLVSGHSGGGKTTIMRSLMNNEIISFTTRPKRPHEVDGKDYIFITKEQYHDMFNKGELAEWTEYGGNYYGLTKQEIDSKLQKDHAYCIVDAHGMQQLKKLYPNTVTIFIYTSKEDAEKQMRQRGESESTIQLRLSTYEKEMLNRHLYDYVVRNNHGRLEDTIEIVRNIILAEI
jgi:guanylate kinase